MRLQFHSCLLAWIGMVCEEPTDEWECCGEGSVGLEEQHWGLGRRVSMKNYVKVKLRETLKGRVVTGRV